MSQGGKIPPQRGFPPQEFEERVARAQALMARQDLDALLLTTEPEVRYFTGFLTQFWQSPTRPWFVILPQAGKPIAVIPTIGAVCMEKTWITDIRTWPSPQPEDEGVSLVVDTLKEILGVRGRIGIPMGPETHLRLPLADYQRLQGNLSGCVFVDCSALIRDLRLIKSEAEIEKTAYICHVVSDAFDNLETALKCGMTESEIFRLFQRLCLEEGADSVPYLVGGAGAGGYGDIISPPSDRPVQAGDVLILDTGCMFDGYFCDFDRNFAFGEPAPAVTAAHETVWRATEAGFSAAIPGATSEDVFNAMNAVLVEGGAMVKFGVKEGGNDVGRMGHGLGMQLTEWPSHKPGDHTVLAPGMVLTLEPGMEFAPGKVMVHEENIVIREGGAEYLTRRASRSIPIVGAGS